MIKSYHLTRFRPVRGEKLTLLTEALALQLHGEASKIDTKPYISEKAVKLATLAKELRNLQMQALNCTLERKKQTQRRQALMAEVYELLSFVSQLVSGALWDMHRNLAQMYMLNR